jgi:putative endonuclease
MKFTSVADRAAHQRDLAVEYLKSQGISVLDRDWSHANGTLGIVALDDNDVLVVPVIVSELSASSGYLPKLVIHRARTLAVHWMHDHGLRYPRIRVDVIQVEVLSHGQSNIEHVKDVG